MNRTDIDELLARMGKDEPAAVPAFCSPEEFKRKFFQRARLQKSHMQLWRRTVWGLVAASVLLIAGIVLLFRIEVRQFTRETEAVERFRQLVALFGVDSGIGMIDGEPVTFDRQGGRASRIVKLAIYDRFDRRITTLELAVGAEDYLELDGGNVKGAVCLQQGPAREQILEFSLALTLADGRTVRLGDIDVLEPGRRYTAQEMGFRIEKRLLKI